MVNIKKTKQPAWMAPMLATLVRQVFSDSEWIFERKLDGMRCVLCKKGDKVAIWSRNKKEQNQYYPEIVVALEKYKSDFILDCEIVAFKGKQTSFERLQERMHIRTPSLKLIRKVPLTVFVFDIMYLNGYDLTGFPLFVRKNILKENFKFFKPFKCLTYKKANGIELMKYAIKNGWEGIIGKKINSTYVHRRSMEWLKFKCDLGQEFVVGGYTKPQGQRNKFGALLLGYYEDGKLKYAGKVGTGFNESTLAFLHTKMQKVIRKSSPFVDFEDVDEVTWLEPKLVVQIGYSEWTANGRLRHPRYLGLRSDKKASSVFRENYGNVK